MKHTPESILAAAVSVFDDVGVGASTAKVAAAAGVANGTLFNYFPTKHELVDALYVWLKGDLAQAIGSVDGCDDDPRAQMSTIWSRWLAWASRHPDRHRVMILLHRSGLASEHAQARAAELFHAPMALFDRAHASGCFVDLPTAYLADLVQDQLDQAVRARLDDTGRALAFEVLWRGLTATTHDHPAPHTIGNDQKGSR